MSDPARGRTGSAAPAGDPGADPDEVRIATVGIDIGSATSHLLFSRVVLRRLADRLSSRFVVVEREVAWRSPVRLTPYRSNGLIDAEAVGVFVGEAYRGAGIEPGDVDSGAVILTGTALRRANARAIAEEVAADSGRFVCASAGHHLEAVLAAHGSGATARSATGAEGVHVDIGGGTAKLAVVRRGRVAATAAIAVGGRLVAYDGGRRLVSVDGTLSPVLRRIGLPLEVGQVFSREEEQALAGALAGALVAALDGRPGAAEVQGLLLTEPLPAPPEAQTVTFSGGVAEYMRDPRAPSFGDMSPALAGAILERLRSSGRRAEVLEPGIRATVIGASQFTVQVSGSTISADGTSLPLRNLPVVAPSVEWADDIDTDTVADSVGQAVARRQAGLDSPAMPGVALSWAGEPSHRRLRAVAEAMRRVWHQAGRPEPLVVVFDRDVAASFARVIQALPDSPPEVVVLDGLELAELDYLDIGRVIQPAGVVPVVVKSLLFR